MNFITQNYELVPLERLTPHPRNVNQGNDASLSESLDEIGFYGAIYAQTSTSYIVAGNHRYRKARDRNAKTIPVIWLEIDDETALRIVLADNRVTRLGHDDPTALAELLQELAQTSTGLAGTGYTADDLDTLLTELARAHQPATEPDSSQLEHLAELQTKWNTQPGQLWHIPSQHQGITHRILCGDSTDASNIERLTNGLEVGIIIADPPYGISIVRKDGAIGSSGHAFKPVHGDENSSIACKSAKQLLEAYPKAVHIWWGGNYYADALPPSSCWIVWDKQNDALSFADAELAWTNQPTATRIFRHQWNGAVTASERDQERFHPTQKPIALYTWLLDRHHDQPGALLDPFLGSGSSLIAAEQTRRTGLGIEFDPEYVAAILERFALTGLEPRIQP